ncbi:MAG TPA: sulfotransferase [Streptosporangiaceae bacterium]|nr:sulfotransferase [Streptosporangiaceae bacterium]
MTAAPRPAADPGGHRQAPPGAVSPSPARASAQSPRPHILVVNGRKVRQPVFVIGAPCSGTGLLARSLKRSAGFHFTLGQRWVIPVVQAFARRPSISRGRPEAAATVLRDAFAQAWQVTADCCLGCTQQCREAGRIDGVGPCVSQRAVTRYGDASPDLMYCADALLDAFPDARVIQIIRDGRDAVAGMLADPAVLGWFRPGFVDIAAEFPHPLLGLEAEADRAAWPGLSPTAKCAMRWRGTVRQMARLRARLPPGQLITFRYEDVIRQPADAAAAVSDFLGTAVHILEPPLPGRPSLAEPGSWRRLLVPAQAGEIEAIAGEELRRVGYGG